MRPPPPSLHVDRAVAALHCGGVIAYPTEAVWGLGCDPADEFAVDRLLTFKNRPVSKGLILVASTEAQFEELLVDLDPELRSRLSSSWPGPTSWLIPHKGRVPRWIHGDHSTVALRVSEHPIVCALCDRWGGALVSTSANPTGARAAIELFQLRRYFGDSLDAILPGSVGPSRRPSRIRDLLSDRIVRT